MSHDHTHHLSREHNRHARPIAITLALVLLYMGLEVVGGVLSGSLALLADAGHLLSDAGALALTLFAMKLARQPATPQRTYGYYRVEILAALANGATLVAIALFIFVEAYERLNNPPQVEGALMLAVACGGLAVNAAGLWILRTGNDANLNVRGACANTRAARRRQMANGRCRMSEVGKSRRSWLAPMPELAREDERLAQHSFSLQRRRAFWFKPRDLFWQRRPRHGIGPEVAPRFSLISAARRVVLSRVL